MKRWYGKFFGFIAGWLLMRHPGGAVIGLLVGHAFDADWFRFADRREAAYRTLGVAETASDTEIEQAYRRLIAQYHPDRLVGVAEELRRQAEQRAAEINAAYDRIRKLRQKR